MSTTGSLSIYAGNAFLRHLHRIETFDRPERLWLGLSTAQPTDADFSEVPKVGTDGEDTGYGRVDMDAVWSRPSQHLSINREDKLFPAALSSWGQATHCFLADDDVGGNLLCWMPASAALSIASGDVVNAVRENIPIRGLQAAGGAVSTSFLNGIILHLTGNGTLDFPSNLYLAALTAQPLSGDRYEEVPVVGTGYSRTNMNSSWELYTDGAVRNHTAATFSVATADWGVISHLGLFTASTTGSLIWWTQVPIPDTIVSGGILTIPARDLRVTL